MDVDSSCVSPSTSGNGVFEYSHMIVPPTMRSQYWQYFGFPCDNYNNIVTKKKVICTLCNAVISYNKNTTNLRTHLVAKHPNNLYELNGTKRIKTDDKSPDSSDDIKPKSSNSRSMPEKEYERYISGDEQSKINEQTAIIEALVDSEINENDPNKINERNEFQEYNTSLDPQSYQVLEIDDGVAPNQEAVSESVVNMLVKDLLPVSILEGVGFIDFVYTISPNIGLPSRQQIERNLKNAHDTMFNVQIDLIRNHTENRPFSLGVEFWCNIERQKFANIFVNFIPPEKDQLKSILYKTISIGESTNLEVFDGINLKNCTAAVVNGKSNTIYAFLNTYEIPIIMCFGTLIQKCLKKAFEVKNVETLLESVIKHLQKSTNSENQITIPTTHEEFPSTKLTLLSYFYEKFSTSYAFWTEDTSQLLEKSKEIIDCLSPLKVTLETLEDEPVALYSLLKPLVTKLLNDYFRVFGEDSENVTCIKEIISNELSECVCDKSFPALATFFDPRFLNFIEDDTLQLVKDVINSKCSAVVPKEDPDKDIKRRSSLKLFFENDYLKRNPKVTKANSDMEIEKYTNELCDIEQCPLTWWRECGYVYRNLKTIAHDYICVPATVNSIFKKNVGQQIQYHNKQKMLKSDTEMTLLYLHFNK